MIKSLASHGAHVHSGRLGRSLRRVLLCIALAGVHAWPQAAAPPKTYYFSDCQDGAMPSCVQGHNWNPGTSPSAPMRDLGGVEVNDLPPGTRLLFARGAVWTTVQGGQIANYNVTPEQPLVFDAYGSGPLPWFRTPRDEIAFNFYDYPVHTVDGGYTLRNLRLDGQGIGLAGVAQGWGTTHITLDGVVIEGYRIGMHLGQGTRHLTVRRSTLRDNREHGILGAGNDWLIEGNRFEGNGNATPPGTHSIYISAGALAERITLRGNTIRGSSLAEGRCRSGNLTIHGTVNGVLIEGNTLHTPGYGPGCRGASITAGYDKAESMRGVVLRGNRFINAGVAIAFSAAPGIVIEHNLLVDTTGQRATLIEPARNFSGGDDAADGAAVVRHNTVYVAAAGAGSTAIRSLAGDRLLVSSNLVYFGRGSHPSHACFDHGSISSYVRFDDNLCHHASGQGRWSTRHATLAAARRAGFDVNGRDDDPLFVALPSAANDWGDGLQAASPAAGRGRRLPAELKPGSAALPPN